MIPKDKHDIAAVEKLKTADAEAVIPLLPKLLEWVQDMNWPIAEPMVELLLHYPNELTPLVDEVLRGDDDMWIYWCLVSIVPKLPFIRSSYWLMPSNKLPQWRKHHSMKIILKLLKKL